MQRFWHMESDDGKTEIIRQGFSWTACISGLFGLFPLGTIIWMLFRKLWLRALGWFGLLIVLSIPMGIINDYESNNAGGAGVAFLFVLIPLLILGILPGFHGNQWTMLNRLKKGYIDKGEIEAANEIEAIRIIQRQTNKGVHSKS